MYIYVNKQQIKEIAEYSSSVKLNSHSRVNSPFIAIYKVKT